jgi:hypothetical protein
MIAPAIMTPRNVLNDDQVLMHRRNSPWHWFHSGFRAMPRMSEKREMSRDRWRLCTPHAPLT